MVCNKEILVDLQEKYEKVRKLIDEDSKHDPENEPYLSKYAAKQILTSMKTNLTNAIDKNESDSSNKQKLIAMLGAVWLNLGIISVDTDELSTGEEQLTKCIECLEERWLNPDCILIVLNALNQLGILWSQRDDQNKSKEYLDRSEKLYHEFKSLKITPIDVSDLFRFSSENIDTENEAFKNLEKIHTLTLYYVAQVYGNLKNYIKSAIYFHITLKRQLESKEYDPIEWALNSATLSQFFMERNGFKQAKHHLSAASYMLDKHKKELDELEDSEETLNAKKERLRHRSADVARCWAKYGLLLLNNSKERLLRRTDEDETENDQINPLTEDLSRFKLENETSELYFSLELTIYDEQVTDKYVLMFDDAREVFLNIQSWLNQAKEYYTLEHHASDYVQIIQDTSEMFKSLAFFEDDEERQCKMHKRRIDNLEAVVKELNPTYYLDVCRQIWYELAEIYSELLHVKFEKLQKSNVAPTPHALKKINTLAEKSIENYKHFLDSVKEIENEKELSEDLVKPVLMAFFRSGRLFEKIIQPNKRVQLQNTQNSLLHYQWVVNYCKKHESAMKLLKTEFQLCDEIVQLLPHKIEKLRREI